MKTKTPARNKDIKAQRRNREIQALRELEERVEQLVLTFKPTKLIAGCEERCRFVYRFAPVRADFARYIRIQGNVSLQV